MIVRRLSFVLAPPLAVALVLLLPLPASVEGAGSACSYLTPAGSLRPAGAGDRALLWINQLVCVLAEVRERQDATLPSEVACVAVTVPASTRQVVSLPTATAMTGSETILPSLRDSTAPSLTEAPTIVSASGTTVQLAVFNRDAGADHAVNVCAHIVRP